MYGSHSFWVSPQNLSDDIQPRSNSNPLMKVLDGINPSGLDKWGGAGRVIAPEWQMKRDLFSPAYTIRWLNYPLQDWDKVNHQYQNDNRAGTCNRRHLNTS
ncbi:DUF4113 domain-containing protein [Salmonella enterica]|nr:DUF4113 domain-containing protein [Salmonella enterica]EEK7629534.1 DUF4113 domain-containing protein [Salmonella enterica subsp. enterica serovar Newport]